MIRAALALAVVASAGCSGILGPGEDRVESNRERWRSARPADYRFTFQRVCFCAGTQPVVITVEGDRITDVRPADGDEEGPRSNVEYRTIDGLFEQLRTWLNRDPADARMEFHDRLGYPADVFIDFSEEVADEELGFRVSDLRPLEGGGG